MRILLLLIVVALESAVSSAQPRAVASRGAIAWSDLPLELSPSLPGNVRFGYLWVPEDHADPDGKRLRMAFIVLPAYSSPPAPDPIVLIPGGPGLAGIKTHAASLAASPQWDLYRARRDVIILDPRGHGYSEPARCSGLSGEPPPGASPAAEQRWLSRLADCRRRLVAQGVRLETLSAVQVAHDLDALRKALGAPQLNLYGSSYGTRIAAEAMRQVPAAIRAVHFSGPVPAGRFRGGVGEAEVAEEVLGSLMRHCAEQAECRKAYPQLRADYEAILASVRLLPVRLPLPASADAPADELVLDEALARVGLSQLLLNRTLAAAAPLIIHALANSLTYARGRAWQLPRAIEGDDGIAADTYLAFRCNDAVVSRSSAEHLQNRCRTFLGAAYDGRDAAPVTSDIPAVITAGELDPRTPPSYAHFLARGLSRAQVAIAPFHGHERPPDCSYRISRDLYETPGRVPDTSCLHSVSPIAFVSGVVPAIPVSNVVLHTLERPWVAVVPGAAALLLAGSAIGLVIRRIRRGRSTLRSGRDVIAVALLAVTAVALVFIVGMAAALVAGMKRHFLVPVIGLPDTWAWLLSLPWVLLVMTAVCAVLCIRGTSATLDNPPALLRWSTLAGATVLLAFWFGSALV